MSPRRPWVLGSFLALMLLSVPTAAMGAAAATSPGVPAISSAASSTPTPKTTGAPSPRGHAHLLAAPRRLASSATGLRLPRHRLAAHSTTRVFAAGVAGLPTHGIRALMLSVTSSRPTGATTVAVGSGTTPVLAVVGGTTSAFTIVPLSRGALPITVGAHATDLALDVVGWFSESTQSGTAGLWRPLGGHRLATVSVPAGATRAIKISGREDIPATGLLGALVRVTTASAGSGTLAVGPSARLTRGYVTAAYRAGARSDLAVVRPGAHGAVTVRNTGTRPVTVSVDAVGWFTNGADPTTYGDTLSVATAFTSLRSARVGTTGRRGTSCGLGGIPGSTSDRPASLVLAHAVVSKATTTMRLTVDAAAATPAGTSALIVPTTRAVAAELLLPPGASCATRYATTAGTAAVTAVPYAWFAGATVLSPDLRVLPPATLALITSVSPTSIELTGTAADLPLLETGNVIAAGISTATPEGLLRRVLAISSAPGRLTLTTQDAPIGDAILQGSVVVGQTRGAPVAPRLVRGVSKVIAPDCGAEPTAGGIGASVTCSVHLGDGTFSADVTVASALALTLNLDISWGLPPNVHLTSTLSSSTSAQATVSATVAKSLDESHDLGTRRLTPIDIQIGAFPLIIVPELAGALHLTGELQATLSGTVGMQASSAITFDSDHGFTPSSSSGGQGSGSYTASVNANIKATFEPSLRALFYGLGGSYLSVGVSPFVELLADSCVVKGHAGAGIDLGISIGITAGVSLDRSFSIPVVDSPLFHLPWRNCALWSGSFSFKENAHYFDNQGRPVGNLNTSVEARVVTPADGSPPEFQAYDATGSGSGAEEELFYPCSDGSAATSTSIWGGDVIEPQQKVFTLAETGIPGYTTVQSLFRGTIDGSYSLKVCGTSDSGAQTHDSNFALMADPSGSPPTDQGSTDLMVIATPPGQNDYSGTRTRQEPQANGGSATFTLTYQLHKTCLLGGSDC